ncbi:uncharacterized protein LOC124155097 [Ischnura elegans]|uniref:uncharacterized protein LOC124155097 n=1 Tax=Ischnura elegans TaxID=197161 RepID=UPI001ED8BB27|nr:uncharacterized protein LOC124155097 [Ischnura elegans]
MANTTKILTIVYLIHLASTVISQCTEERDHRGCVYREPRRNSKEAISFARTSTYRVSNCELCAAFLVIVLVSFAVKRFYFPTTKEAAVPKKASQISDGKKVKEARRSVNDVSKVAAKGSGRSLNSVRSRHSRQMMDIMPDSQPYSGDYNGENGVEVVESYSWDDYQ